jgi:hypothetical protein
MTTTYAAVHFIANGKPYIFSSDVTDATADATNNMLNVVSSRGLGDTFAAGATITHIGPVTLNSSDGTGASKSALGAVVTDPQNNAVAEISWVDPETAPITGMVPCNIPVGLNFALKILTTNT